MLNLLFYFFLPALLLTDSKPVNPEYTFDEPKLILIHLDAVSSYYLNREIENGNLPNIENYFGDEGRIDYAITYFPSKTPAVISSIRLGEHLEDVPLPGWARSDKATESDVGLVSTFLGMAFSKSRLATTNLIYGLPGLYWMAPTALINTADYLKDYNILQFYWYRVDSEGHFRGEEAYIRELKEFDRHFGRLAKRLDENVNIVIYSDHGMTFGKGVEIDSYIEEMIGDDLAVFSFPTLFLNDSDKAGYYARRLADETELDFTFYRKDENHVKGYHKNGIIRFIGDNDKIKYEFEGDDIFGYSGKGYRGEYLSRDEWLEFSYNLDYPLAPVNLFYFFKNQNSGEIITLFDDTKFHQTGYSSDGNHGGFTHKDMLTPLLIKGPNVDHLYDRVYFWLPELFNEIEGIDFDQHPPRERSFMASRYDVKRNRQVMEVSFSPQYRIRYGTNFYLDDFLGSGNLDRAEIWGKADIFRSYLTRAWIGTGVEIQGAEIKPLFMFQYDIHIRRFVFQNSLATNRQFYFRASWEATPWLAFETVNLNSIGLRFDF